MKKRLFSRHPFVFAAIFLFLSSFFTLFIMQLIELQHAGRAFLWIFTHPIPALCAIFLFGLVSALLFALTKRLWIAGLVPAAFGTILAFVNYFKCRINAAPLLLSDFTLAGQLGDIAGYAKTRLVFSSSSILGIAAAALLILALIAADLFLKKHVTRRGRIAWLALSVFLVILVVFTPAFTSLSAKISEDMLTQEERNASLGVFYGLYCAYASVQTNTVAYNADDISALFDAPPVTPDAQQEPEPEPEPVRTSLEPHPDAPEETPDAGPKDEVQDPAQPDEPQEPEEKILPNVIFVMSESLFDITRLPNLEFSEDPLANFHAMAETSTSGSFMTPAYCGGTAYVEMEVLTGLTSYLLKENDTLTALPDEVYPLLPSIVSVFEENDYASIFFHSHTNALYNREPNYHAMGFDQVLFSDSCPEDAEKKAGFISDKAFSEKIISLYEERDPEKPLFMLNVSMENHQPYHAAKYDEPSGITITSPYLDETDIAIVDSYVLGLRDADLSLGMLKEYFSQVEEPVMLIFWGDHLPNLNLTDGQSIFTKLGYASNVMTTDWGPEELSQMLSTEYVIWTNYEEPGGAEPDHTESCTFLGLHVLQRIGLELNPYFSWLAQNVMPYMTIYRARLFVDADGVPYREVPEQYQSMLEAYRLMEYDLVYGEKRILQLSNAVGEADEPDETDGLGDPGT